MVKHTQTIQLFLFNLSVFDHFARLTFKGLSVANAVKLLIKYVGLQEKKIRCPSFNYMFSTIRIKTFTRNL